MGFNIFLSTLTQSCTFPTKRSSTNNSAISRSITNHSSSGVLTERIVDYTEVHDVYMSVKGKVHFNVPESSPPMGVPMLVSSAHAVAENAHISGLLPSAVLSSSFTLYTPHLSSRTSPRKVRGSTLKAGDFVAAGVLGKGGQGTVYDVTDTRTGKQLALKIVPKARLRLKSYGRIFNEQVIMKSLTGDPWFLSLAGSFQDHDNFYFLSKFYGNGTLAERIRSPETRGSDTGCLDPEVARQYTAEVIFILEVLQRRRIIHRDIKPDNLLIDDSGHLVLADFGLARSFGLSTRDRPWAAAGLWAGDKTNVWLHTDVGAQSDVTCTSCGTPGYIPPEVYDGSYSYTADMWSAGIVVYMMILGRLPFGLMPECHNSEQMRRITTLMFVDFCSDDVIDEDAKDLLCVMLEKAPERRATVAELKTHPYFRSIDWDSIMQRKGSNGFVKTNSPTPIAQSASPHDHHAVLPLEENKVHTPPLPTHAGTSQKWLYTVPIPVGVPYTRGKSPFPWFNWLSPALQYDNSGSMWGVTGQHIRGTPARDVVRKIRRWCTLHKLSDKMSPVTSRGQMDLLA